MKETTTSTPVTTGRGGGLATAILLVFSRQTENGGPLAPVRNSPAWPHGRATGGQRPRGETRKAGVGSSARPKSGVLSPGVVSFHSRRDGLAERPYVTSLLTHTTHRTLRRLKRAGESDWPPSRGGWSRRSTAQARGPAPQKAWGGSPASCSRAYLLFSVLPLGWGFGGRIRGDRERNLKRKLGTGRRRRWVGARKPGTRSWGTGFPVTQMHRP